MSKPAKNDGVTASLAVVCTGIRGDIMQHIALAVGLRRLGNFQVKLVTHEPYRTQAQAHGLQFAGLKGDPSAIVTTTAAKSAIESNNALAIAALLTRHADSIMEANMTMIHDACKGVDGIVCSIACLTECLAIGQKYQRPVILAPLLPYSPSGELPLIHLLPKPLEYTFLNKLSYELSGTLLWAAAGGLFNKFRTKTLGIGPQSGYMLAGVSQVAGFSTVAVPRPSDWGSHVHQTSHWVLPEPQDKIAATQPRLHAAMAGSMSLDVSKRPIVAAFEGLPLPDMAGFIRSLHKVAVKAGVMAVFLAGADAGGDKGEWASLRTSPRLEGVTDVVLDLPGLPATLGSGNKPVPTSPRVIIAAHAPYEWLFPQASIIIHQGGALVTQAAWASGVPAVAFPAFGDQWFWAARIAASGIGPQVVFPLRDAAGRLEECVGLARSGPSVQAAANLGNAMRGAGDGVYAAVMTIRDVLSRPQHRHCGVTCSWVPDESRQTCSMCEGPFTLLNRRRHCRSCGRLACTKCLTQRCHLPGFPEDAPQLTCTTCLDHRRAFFAMHVGELAVPPLPDGVRVVPAGAGGVGGGAGAMPSPAMGTPAGGLGSPAPRSLASVLSPGAAASLAQGFDAVDLVSSGPAAGATALQQPQAGPGPVALEGEVETVPL